MNHIDDNRCVRSHWAWSVGFIVLTKTITTTWQRQRQLIEIMRYYDIQYVFTVLREIKIARKSEGVKDTQTFTEWGREGGKEGGRQRDKDRNRDGQRDREKAENTQTNFFIRISNEPKWFKNFMEKLSYSCSWIRKLLKFYQITQNLISRVLCIIWNNLSLLSLSPICIYFLYHKQKKLLNGFLIGLFCYIRTNILNRYYYINLGKLLWLIKCGWCIYEFIHYSIKCVLLLSLLLLLFGTSFIFGR